VQGLVGDCNDPWQSAIETSSNVAEKGCSGTGTGGEFGLNCKGRTLENMKKSKGCVAGDTRAAKQRK
jgi:hypothetical protein